MVEADGPKEEEMRQHFESDFVAPQTIQSQLAVDDDEPIAAMKEHILKLPLPAHLNHLMALFEQFEMNIRMLKQRQDTWTISLDTLSAQIEKSMHKSFKESHFR